VNGGHRGHKALPDGRPKAGTARAAARRQAIRRAPPAF
jgi:hypothetical protein